MQLRRRKAAREQRHRKIRKNVGKKKSGQSGLGGSEMVLKGRDTRTKQVGRARRSTGQRMGRECWTIYT